MNCPKCGKELTSDARYCYHCGSIIPRSSQADVLPKKTNSRTKWLAIIAAVFLLMIAITLLMIPGINRMRYRSLVKDGNRYLTEMKYKGAVVAFTKAIRIENKEAIVYLARGNAYVGLADQIETEDDIQICYLLAEKDYLTALDLDEMMTDAYEALSNVYLAQDKLEDALDILEVGYELTGERKLSEKTAKIRNLVTAANDNSLVNSVQKNINGDSLKPEEEPDTYAVEEARTLMDGSEEEYVFNSGIDKRAIKSIVFEDNLNDMPPDAWDISANKDGSVWAWVERCEPGMNSRGYDGEWCILYIAGDGGVNAGKSCESLFSGYKNMETIEFNDCFNTKNVTNMTSMFEACASLEELDLSGFNTSQVETMNNMFQACDDGGKGFDSSLKKLNISSFDTSKVTNMSGMFSGCILLEELDVSSFDTSRVTNMASMFYSCSSIRELNLSNFNTSRVETMTGMFMFCEDLEKLYLSNFITSQVTDMSWMFWECSDLQELDVSNFDTSQVTNMGSMFRGCSSLKTLDISNFNTSSVINMSDMFNGCRSLQSLDINALDMSNVEYDTNMFSGTQWK